MHSSVPRRPRVRPALLPVLQSILLVTAVVLVPARAIAQDAEPGAESAPQAPASVLLVQPEPVKLTVSESRVLTAWNCPAGTAGPLGGDADPLALGCAPVEAEWSLNEPGAAMAELGKDESARTRITALAATDDLAGDDVAPKVIASVAGLEPAKARLNFKAPEPAPEPQPEPVVEQQPEQQPPAQDEPKAEEPRAEEPRAEEPKQEQPLAQDEPKAEEPTNDGPKDEPKGDGQNNNNNDQPADNDGPRDEPKNDGPKDEPKAEEPVVEPAPEPEAVEPAPEPEAVEPAPEPEAVEPAPEPEAVEPAPEPEAVEPAPEPEAVEPAPEPEAVESAPEPEAVESAPEPVVEAAIEEPIAEAVAVEPLVVEDMSPAVEPDVQPASHGTITVTVYGNGTTPLPGATVSAFLPGTNTVAGSPCVTGDPSGQCTITGLDAPGSYDVRVTVAPAPFSSVANVWLGSAFGSPLGGGNPAGVFPYQPDLPGDSDQAPDPIPLTGGDPSAETRLVVQRANRPQPEECGVDIALIIDRSGSTEDDDQDYIDAAKAFVDALVGTPSEVGVWSFAAQAQGAAIQLTDVNAVGPAPYNFPGGLIAQAIDNLPDPAGATNWDEGISQVVNSGADVAILVTDGNPTTQSGFWDSDTGSGGTVHVYDVEGGITSANAVKQTGMHFISVAIGIGNTVNLNNLSPAVYSGQTADDLEDLLFQIATTICGGTVIVQKEVPDDPWQLADGWEFTATTPASGVTDPGTGETGQNSGCPLPGGSDPCPTGIVVFDFDNNGTIEAVIRETDNRLNNGWQLVKWPGDKNAVCEKADGNGGQSVTVLNADDIGIRFDLGPTDIVTCTFRDEPKTGSIELKKVWVGTPGQTTLRIGTSEGGTQVDSQQTGPNGLDPLTTGANEVAVGTYYLSETGGLAAYTTADLSCTGAEASPVNEGGQRDWSIQVAADETVVCTFTNTREQGSIELKKDWVGTPDDVTLNIGTSQGGSQVDTGTANGADGTTGPNTVNTGTYYLSEVGNLYNYEVGDLECDGAAADPQEIDATNWSIQVAADETVVCTFTNTREQGSIELKKDWVGTPDDVTLNIGTSQGGSQVDTGTANGADGTTGPNTVNTGTYYLSETGGLAAYTTADLSCTGAEASPVNEGGQRDWSIQVAADETVVCTFTNTREQGSIELKKDWVGTPGNVTLNIGTSQGGSQVDTGTANGADGTTGPNTVNTGTYYLSEVGNLSDYEVGDLECDGAAADPQEIDATNWSIQVAADETVVCTFTNKLIELTLDKSVSSAPSFAGGFWTVGYQVAVSNTGAATTTYDLVDVPNFGPGVTVTKMSSGALEDTTAPFSLQLATGKSIASGVTDTYTVTVQFTVAGSASSTDLDCLPADGLTATGTLNTATVTFNGNTIKDHACAPISNLIIDKAVTSPPSFAAGVWTIVYAVKVENTGPVAATYNLSDTPTFGAGVNIQAGSVSGVEIPGTIPLTLPTTTIVTGKSIASTDPNTIHTYTVTIQFTVAGSATSANLDCQLVGGESGTGTLNTATVTFNGNSIKDDACAPVPKLTLDKTVTSAPSFAGGVWSVGYQVAVKNEGPIATTYDLVDVPTFGASVTVTKMSSGTLEDTTPPFSLQLATGKSINPGVTDTYAVAVQFTVAGTSTSANLDCQLASGETGTGTLNTATVTFNGNSIKDDACAPIPKLTITKTATTTLDEPPEGPTTVRYRVEVKNEGPIATTYDLVDVPMFGDGVTVTKMSSGTLEDTTPPFSLQLAAGKSIDPGVTDSYTVRIVFTVDDEATLNDLDLDCEPADGSAPTGTLNRATVTFNGNSLSAQDCEPIPSGGGGGAGGGPDRDQPPTDMLAPTGILSATTEGGSPLDGPVSWALWVLLTAALIVSGAWVIRKQRFSEI